jgi:predicted glycoside hydrolase/deacetylase ChbG (UPF0249 family)
MTQIGSDLKTLIINADDFAQSAAVDAAIIDLAKRKAINATSVLVLSPRWEKSANTITELPIQVGLHLDLTSEFTHTFDYHYLLSKLICAAYIRQLSQQRLEQVIELQWNRFTDYYGRSPDFIDGHQHVHQLPIVRAALFAVITKRGWNLEQNRWLRCCYITHWRGRKDAVISVLGARRFQQQAHALGIKTNTDFAGDYNFSEHANMSSLWERWLSILNGNMPLIMCHIARPNQSNAAADVNEVLADSIYAARLNEYQWLASDDFQRLLRSKGYGSRQ